MNRVVAALVGMTLAIACLAACRCGYEPPPPQDVPPCGVTSGTSQEQALAVIRPLIQFRLEDGTTCTPGAGEACATTFDEGCNIDVGDVEVGAFRRTVITVINPSSVALAATATLEGDCVDAYVEGVASAFVEPGSEGGVAVVIRATETGTCDVRVVVDSDAGNVGFTGAPPAIDVSSRRIEGGAPGCSTANACCCLVNAANPPACDEDGRLACASGVVGFGDACTDDCVRAEGDPVATTWIRVYDGVSANFLGGPERFDDDVLVLSGVFAAPCKVERLTSTGGVAWSRELAGLSTCESLVRAGSDAILVAGDGAQTALQASAGVEAATPIENEGRTVLASFVAVESVEIEATAAASIDGADFVLRRLDATAAALGDGVAVVGAQPSAAFQHFLVARADGDTVLAFMRASGATPTTFPVEGGGAVTMPDASGAAVLHLAPSGNVRRAFVLRGGVVAGAARDDNTFAVCGRAQDPAALVELVPDGSEVTHAAFASGAVAARFDDDGVAATFAMPDFANATCAFDRDGTLFAVLTSAAGMVIRELPSMSERALVDGDAVALSASIDDASLVVLAATRDPPGSSVQPLFPAETAPVMSAAFVLHVLRSDLGL